MDIYQPREDSELLNKHIQEYATGCVLDMGTGSGIQALTAIKNATVRDVVAVDINPEAVNQLKKKIKENHLRKIKVIQSNLFQNITTKFDLIIFNPPYLPQDEGIEDPALYGGKKGWEVSAEFLNQAASHLVDTGKILFLFSTLTNKNKIEQLIKHNLLEFQQIDSLKLSFEELFVYEITKSELLKDLNRQEIQNIHYLTEGKRGIIYTGLLEKSKRIKTHFAKKEQIKVAIKTKNPSSTAQNTIANEAYWMRKLSFAPNYLFHKENYVVYEFVEGQPILEYIQTHNKQEILTILKEILLQCRQMDKMQVNKDEMHHPLKHILIKNHPIQLDFERCTRTDKPQNVTQLIEFIRRLQEELTKKDIKIDHVQLQKLAQEYKDTYEESVFMDILAQIQ